MLIMRWKNGRIKYSYQPQNTNYQSYIQLAPLPIVHFRDAINSKIKLQQWYNKYYYHIDKITDMLLEAFYAFLEQHTIYQIHFNESQFRQVMTKTLYDTSFNSYKNFP